MIPRLFFALLYMLALSREPPLCQIGNSTPDLVTQEQYYKVGNELSRPERENILSEIRAFLWEKVTHHESTQLRVTFYTIEGDPTTYQFHAENSDDKKWCLSADIVIEHPSQPHKKKAKREVISHSYCEVFRLDVGSGLRISDAEDREPKTYKLRLRDTSKPDELTL
jgi:hypothetical protein